MMQTLLWLALAGAAGTLARFGLTAAVAKLLPGSFPWGTLVVNAAGCFLFGLTWSLAESRASIGPQARTAALTGFLGAFTTYSTFAFDASRMLKASDWVSAAGYVLAHLVVGVGLLFAGIAAGR